MTSAKSRKTKSGSRPSPTNGPRPAPKASANKTVTFKGRKIQVKKPTPDQLYVWERLLRNFEKRSQEANTLEQMFILLDRVQKIIYSVVVKEEDRNWLEDGELEGTITIQEATGIVLDALAAYEDELKSESTNRVARRVRA